MQRDLRAVVDAASAFGGGFDADHLAEVYGLARGVGMAVTALEEAALGWDAQGHRDCRALAVPPGCHGSAEVRQVVMRHAAVTRCCQSSFARDRLVTEWLVLCSGRQSLRPRKVAGNRDVC